MKTSKSTSTDPAIEQARVLDMRRDSHLTEFGGPRNDFHLMGCPKHSVLGAIPRGYWDYETPAPLPGVGRRRK